MGAGVSVLAGELLGVPQFLRYGRTKLRRLVERTEVHGD